MGAAEPRPRRRGFFFFSTNEEEPDGTEQDDPEGLTNRLRLFRPRTHQQEAGASRHSLTGGRMSGGRRHLSSRLSINEATARPAPGAGAFRTASATDSRRR
jgi:hypothetical protein